MEIYEILKDFIKPELLVLIPVLYLIGISIHKSKIKNEFIPLFLGCISIILVLLYLLATSSISGINDVFLLIFTAFTQGILLSGSSVYINQLIKQTSKIKKG